MVGRLVIAFAAIISAIGFVPTVFAGALHEAAREGEMRLASKLIDEGADLNALDKEGETPLTAAVLAGKLTVVRLLLDRGAGVMGRNEGGFTVLHAAAYSGRAQIVELVLERGARINDQKNKAKITPLHAAAERNHVDIATLLVNSGARIGLKERHGYTPLARATLKRYAKIVMFLRDRGAKCPPLSAVGPAHNGFCRNPSN
jgi:ankyrin repeat protein